MNHSVFVILITITYFGLNQACKKNIVEILNQLAPGQILKYHCRSEDDNLGVKQLNFNATPFVIRFHDEIPNLTRWNCIFRQGPNNSYSYDIEVYKAGPRLIPRCGQLRVWAARIDGIYFARKYNTPLVRVLSWNKN
ncbi:putative plant self-incompatibility S1 [Arabidopsis thaliana]